MFRLKSGVYQLALILTVSILQYLVQCTYFSDIAQLFVHYEPIYVHMYDLVLQAKPHASLCPPLQILIFTLSVYPYLMTQTHLFQQIPLLQPSRTTDLKKYHSTAQTIEA